MPTVPSSTRTLAVPGIDAGVPTRIRRAVADLGPLLKFRGATLRGRGRRLAAIGLTIIVGLTVLAAWTPAYLPDPGNYRGDIILLMPTAFAGVLFIAVVSAVSTGGGRELLPRDQGVAFPVSPATDHLGALMMAPLNIAWLMQSWTVLAAIAFTSAGIQDVSWVTLRLIPAQLLVVLWLVCATACAQVLAWCVEWLRRGPHGVLAVRSLGVSLLLVGAYLVWSGNVTTLLDRAPTRGLTIAIYSVLAGHWGSWVLYVFGVVALTALAVFVGALVAGAVARRPAHDETRLETSVHEARPNPVNDLMAVIRTDRASIWRSLPLRRGLLVLAVMPGLVALAGSLQWDMLAILPGLVASGGALLFGVNAWSLDARGALWRDSLPASAGLLFVARVTVLLEILLVATSLTILLAVLRAGQPTLAEAAALACATLVVCLQVVSASMRWSVRRPYSVDLRSARATPAPPLVMVGYSARLALSTTLTGMIFIGAAQLDWLAAVALAIPFVLVSSYRLVAVAGEWARPEVRSRVVSTIAS